MRSVVVYSRRLNKLLDMGTVKVGDRIRCIDPGNNNITENKIYEILGIELGITDVGVRLINDRGNRTFCFAYRFVLFIGSCSKCTYDCKREDDTGCELYEEGNNGYSQ